MWPSGVPTTLWTYRLMQPENLPLLPFTGVSFEPAFLYAFGFGALFIMVFAWQRFKLRSYDVTATHFRVLNELAPVELRGPTAMNRAYLIYVGVLLAIYVLMTFFGKLIVETVGKLPIAGIQVNASELNFSSPQWPLLLAFGFAGFAPMLKPLEVAETWLRRWAHQAVGIPVKVRENTQRLLNQFRTTPGLRPDPEPVPPWVPLYLGRWEPIERVLLIHGQLEVLVQRFENDLNLWPAPLVRERLATLEDAIIEEAKAVLQEFDDLMRESYNEAPPQPAPADGGVAPKADEALRLHQKRMELRLTDIVKRMGDLREQLVAILAVFGERDRNFGKISDPVIQGMMRRAFTGQSLRGGPEFGVLACLVPAFVVYALACAMGLHPLLSYTAERAPLTVLVTAGLETFRLASLMLLPVIAAFAVRQTLLDRGEWAAPDGSAERLARQRMAAIALGWVVATVFLLILSAVWVFCFAENVTHMLALMFGGRVPYVTYFVTQSGLVVPYLLFALLAADTGAGGEPITRGLLGVLSALSVLAWMAGHTYFWFRWSGTPSCTGAFPTYLFQSRDCFAGYGGLDFITYPLVAFLSATLFGAKPSDEAARSQPRRRRGRETAAAAALVLITLALAVYGSAAWADDPAAQVPSTDNHDVRVGFRIDAEPFSYKVTVDDPTATTKHERYIGFIADLCYKIFDGSGFQVVESEVTADNRFRELADGKVDVLCDPVTLRYSGDPLRAKAGIFSPIVFATGVSSLSRRTRSAQVPTYLGFVKGSTAQQVVERVCAIDMLRVRPEDTQKCVVSEETKRCGPDGSSKVAPHYFFCEKNTHDELISWFCERPPAGKSAADAGLDFRRAYYGDRELILAKLRTYREQGGDCPASGVEVGVGSLTYEPYALIVTKTRPDLVQLVQRRIYEFFSHGAEARSLFATYFPDQQMSDALAYLFLLNGVEEENRFISPTAPVAGGG